MAALTDLMQAVQERCSGVFVEGGQQPADPTFGIPQAFTASELLFISAPDRNYSRLESWLLPAPLKALAQGSGKRDIFAGEGLYAFHYPLRPASVRGSIMQLYEINEFLTGIRNGQAQQPEEMYRQFRERYGNSAACLNLRVFGGISLLGPSEVTQEVMDHLKMGGKYLPYFTRGLLGASNLEMLQEELSKKKSVHLYDRLGKPKEVHFELSPPHVVIHSAFRVDGKQI